MNTLAKIAYKRILIKDLSINWKKFNNQATQFLLRNNMNLKNINRPRPRWMQCKYWFLINILNYNRIHIDKRLILLDHNNQEKKDMLIANFVQKIIIIWHLISAYIVNRDQSIINRKKLYKLINQWEHLIWKIMNRNNKIQISLNHQEHYKLPIGLSLMMRFINLIKIKEPIYLSKIQL